MDRRIQNRNATPEMPVRYAHGNPLKTLPTASARRSHHDQQSEATKLQSSSDSTGSAKAASTISRELRRNSATNHYSSVQAQQTSQYRQRQSRPRHKLHTDSLLFGVVQHFLQQRWSPEQIALALASLYPKSHEYRVSHETIYNCIYAQPVGELKRDLIACLRQAKNKRVPRSKGQDRRGQIPDRLSIHLRPPDIEDCQFPGH
ncbi:hypothetical protein EDE11_14010 [Methylomonas methanica]|uniref:Transposase n=1 Tax=Methylomonas methanica TaxID=421 RepID=A0ABY2CG64_METMH|nr:hypothetical protein EDE11_14010 [Methylomonas methanica]